MKTRLSLMLFLALSAAWPIIAMAEDMDFAAASGQAASTLTIASITDLAAIRPMIEGFQKSHPDIAIAYRESTSDILDGQAATACREGRFLADLIISSSLPQQVWLVNNGCAQPIAVPDIDRLPGWAKWRDELVGLTFEPAVIVYNKAAFKDAQFPKDRFEFIDMLRQSDRFFGRIGTYDIEKSGVGYFFAFEDSEQASTWGRLLETMGRNKVELFCCTSDILDRVADGRLLAGYNVLGSYAFLRQKDDERIGIVFPSDYTLVLTRAAYIPRLAQNGQAARQFIEFSLSSTGQSILENKMRFFSPIDGESAMAKLAPGNDQPIRPIALTPALLVALDSEKRRMFIEQWRQSLFGPAK